MEQERNVGAAQAPGGVKRVAKPKSNQLWGRVVAFVTVFCLLAALAVLRHGSIFGKDASSFFSSSPAAEQQDAEAAVIEEGSQEVINTTELGRTVI